MTLRSSAMALMGTREARILLKGFHPVGIGVAVKQLVDLPTGIQGLHFRIKATLCFGLSEP